jgi:outer membrane protein assembly factor BamD (BamD/ComL family)
VQHAKGGSILPAPVASSSFASDASEESRAVTAARDALRSGNTGGALSLLAQAQRRFGAGALGQEREALSIEALAKSGQHSAAHTRGELFLKNYAHSPYAARIRALIGSN